jgi:UPF0042 nucleotide-binding protein
MRLIIVTGLSGSGKTIALHTLEDLGYNCIDNLPMYMLKALSEELVKHPQEEQRTAVGIDARNQIEDLRHLPKLVSEMKEKGLECEIVFLEAQDETLIKRFSETRRKHPLTDDDHPLAEAIHLERTLLEPITSDADLRIDTTHTNQHELREIICARLNEREQRTISVMFQSFGYKHGVPRDVDFVFDVRCLPNPHWEQELRPLTGRDDAVARFLESDPDVIRMKQDITQFLEHWIPAFEADGRNYLTIAIGCTGGHHRSVYMVEQLTAHFSDEERQIVTRHRELS